MLALPIVDPQPRAPSLVERARIVAAALLVCAGMWGLSSISGWLAGWKRPPVLLAHGAVLSTIGVLVISLIGIAVGRFVAGRRDLSSLLAVVGLGLLFFSMPAGSMQDWLMLAHSGAAPPTGAAYVALLADYAALLLIPLLAFAVFHERQADVGVGAALAAAMGLTRSQVERNKGYLALLCCVAVATILLVLLSGPRTEHVRGGQVYFSVALAMVGGIYAAHQLTGVGDFCFYWPAPFLVGVVGVAFAAIWPALPAPYAHLNNIPAWGPARALPIEMIGMGLFAVHWTVRNIARHERAVS